MEAALSEILMRTHEVWERDMLYWTEAKRVSAALALALMLCLQYFGHISLTFLNSLNYVTQLMSSGNWDFIQKIWGINSELTTRLLTE